jgi:hypothetical protein
VLDFQEVSHEAAMLLRQDIQATTDKQERARVASALAQVGRTWVSLQDAKREILGKPRLAPVKVEPKRKANRIHRPPTLSDNPTP